MNYLIYYSKKLLPLVLLLILATSCEDYTDLDIKPVDSGSADFSTYVAVGNSLTAGYQNDALYQAAQEFSYPNLITRQVNKSDSFTQPLFSNPGTGGRIELVSLEPLVTTRNNSEGQPLGQDEKPFNNLGVPGAVLVDYLNPQNSGSLKERATNPEHPAFNPLYSIVMEEAELAKDAPNLHNQVAKQDPTFVSFWLGNNDVLGFVTSGGEGQSITPPATFKELYQGSAQALAATGANVVVYNIPNVTNIPFVFYLRTQLEQQGAISFNSETKSYQLAMSKGSFDIYIETDAGPRVMRESDFPILSAQEYFGKVQAQEVSPPITPQDAIPDELVLDGPAGGPAGSSELEQAIGAIQRYNTIIANVASSSGFALVDINGIFEDVFANFQESGGTKGYPADGITLRPVPGELFSFDGVHPTNRGSAVLANESIKSINQTFEANIPFINVAKIPEGFPATSEAVAAGN